MLQEFILENKEYVKISHNRCKNYINNEQIYSNKILNEKELFNKIELNRELILSALPIMNKVYEFVKGSNFFLILTDKDGCILNVIGDEDILSEAFSFKMIPGAYMDEANIGTNAMGTCLIEKKPIQISGKEHFVEAYHRWTCSSSPIVDTEGHIIGTLDLTGYNEYVHLHTLGMVVAAAKAIENELSSNRFKMLLSNEKRNQELIQNSLMMGMIVTDLEGTIITANSHASNFFGYKQDEMLQMDAEKLIKDWSKIQNIVLEERKTYKDDVDVNSKNNLLQLNLSTYPITNYSGEITNIIILLNEVKKQRKQVDSLKGRQAIYTFDKIIGKDKNFLNILNFAKKVADSRSTILITGESGTGKELFAQSIHNYSKKANEPFVALNCGAIPRDLIESELFGYDEGAFTGAKLKGNPGKFEVADGGTIFLDEIGEMPIDLQNRLLRVIEEGTVSRIGSTNERVVNVRVIAATNKDLKVEVEKGAFRKDLFYRLNVLPFHLPSLRERKSDIKFLIDYFMDKISKKLNKKSIFIPDESMEKLIQYDWPGNVRELENYIELIVNTESVIDINGISKGENYTLINDKVKVKYQHFHSLKELEEEYILKVLESNYNNISQTAQILGIGRNTLYRKLKEFNIVVS
ncbi:MAG: hypothetical protein K0Q97_2412 [Bacillota bacterium]|jgi:PAS domain S-box-containing protein|nr:hypothetical protein [Bacillota bacterium]